MAAGGPQAAPGPDELVAGSPDEKPRRRPALRTAGRFAVVAAVALTLALSAAGVGPLDLSLDGPLDADGTAGPPPPGPTYEGMATTAPSRLDGIDCPTRGDLAGDRVFVEGAMKRVRQLRPDASRLFFAGSLPDGARLVLAGTDVNRGRVATRVHALWVRPGTDVARAPVSEATALTDRQQALAWSGEAAHGGRVLVALVRPGPARFEVSGRIRYDRDGAPTRYWHQHPTENGVAVIRLGDFADPAVAVRVRGPGIFPDPILVRSVPRPAPRLLRVEGVEVGTYRGPDSPQLRAGLQAGVGAIVALERASMRVIWSGVPWRHRRLALVLVTRRDGQRFQALVGEDEGRSFAAGTRALAPRADELTPWLLEPFSSVDPTFLLCPTGPGTLVYRRAGRPDRFLPITAAGVAPLVEPGPSPPTTAGADVTVLDPSGRKLLRTVLPEPGFDNPLALS